VEPVSEITAKKSERADLRALAASLMGDASEATLVVDGRVLRVPSSIVSVLRAAAGPLQSGETVAIINEETEVSPAQAARLLGVTRQYVDRLMENDLLPFRRLPGSRYRRLPVRAVLAFAATRERKRAGIERVVEGAIAAGLEY
jgi:excisionase family DNA binding protein